MSAATEAVGPHGKHDGGGAEGGIMNDGTVKRWGPTLALLVAGATLVSMLIGVLLFIGDARWANKTEVTTAQQQLQLEVVQKLSSIEEKIGRSDEKTTALQASVQELRADLKAQPHK
jgi:hypothetical protein